MKSGWRVTKVQNSVGFTCPVNNDVIKRDEEECNVCKSRTRKKSKEMGEDQERRGEVKE